MAKIIVHKKEDLEKALKQFKIRCKREDNKTTQNYPEDCH